jgi:hypothetical protein
MYPMLPMSLDYPFLITSSVFSSDILQRFIEFNKRVDEERIWTFGTNTFFSPQKFIFLITHSDYVSVTNLFKTTLSQQMERTCVTDLYVSSLLHICWCLYEIEDEHHFFLSLRHMDMSYSIKRRSWPISTLTKNF